MQVVTLSAGRERTRVARRSQDLQQQHFPGFTVACALVSDAIERALREEQAVSFGQFLPEDVEGTICIDLTNSFRGLVRVVAQE